MRHPDEPLIIGAPDTSSDPVKKYGSALEQASLTAIRAGVTVEGLIVLLEKHLATLHETRPYLNAAHDMRHNPT